MKLNLNTINIILVSLSLLSLKIGSYAINIFFVLIPFFQKDFLVLKLPKLKLIRIAFFYYCFIGLYGFISYILKIDSTPTTYPIRQIISFILFNSIFFLSFFPNLNITKSILIKSLYISSIINCSISLILALIFGFNLGELNPENSIDFKNELSQHSIGFIYCFAFVSALFDQKTIQSIFIRGSVVLLSLLGIILTFSRSSILALFFGLFSYALLSIFEFLRIKKFRFSFISKNFKILPKKFFSTFVPVIFLSYPVIKFLEIISQNIEKIFLIFKVFGGSESTRLERWKFAFDFTVKNPIYGSSYLGVWAYDDIIGSLHSSYFDILFRTGFIGLFLYLLILTDLINFFFQKKDFVIVSGIFCLLGYGITYESFLWPGGLCIMSILIFLRCNQRFIENKT